jgi:hypothetical protein
MFFVKSGQLEPGVEIKRRSMWTACAEPGDERIYWDKY